jgi:EH domain-containing protein 1
MFSWLKKGPETAQVVENVVGELKKVYKTKLLPLEEHYHFHEFHSPKLEDPDFDAKPMILLVGQYSTGKTTFIRYLLERDFPGIRIGPEPTTDRFIAVMYDEKEGIIPGNALVVDPKKAISTSEQIWKCIFKSLPMLHNSVTSSQCNFHCGYSWYIIRRETESRSWI